MFSMVVNVLCEMLAVLSVHTSCFNRVSVVQFFAEVLNQTELFVSPFLSLFMLWYYLGIIPTHAGIPGFCAKNEDSVRVIYTFCAAFCEFCKFCTLFTKEEI